MDNQTNTMNEHKEPILRIWRELKARDNGAQEASSNEESEEQSSESNSVN